MISDEPIGPTPERLAKAGDQFETFWPDENVNWKAIRLLDGNVLDAMSSRKAINGDQYNAGLQLCLDHYIANSGTSLVIDPSRDIVDNSRGDSITDRRIDAQRRYDEAIKGVGDRHGDYLNRILIFGESLESVGFSEHRTTSPKLAKNAATASLRDALTALAMFYYNESTKRRARMRSSHAADYKPGIMPVEGS